MERWMLFSFSSEGFEFWERTEWVTHEQVNKKGLPKTRMCKSTKTSKQTKSQSFLKIRVVFPAKIKKLSSIEKPSFCSAAIYWVSPCLVSVPRLGHHVFGVCTSCGGYMKCRISFCLFISTLWRSDPLEDSNHCKVLSQGAKLHIQGNGEPVWHSCSPSHGGTGHGITQ